MKLQFFKCEHCGNIAVKLFDEGPALFCCGEKMSELVPIVSRLHMRSTFPLSISLMAWCV